MGEGGGQEAREERVRRARAGLELGVELAADEEGVPGKLDDLHEATPGVRPGHAEPGALELGAEGGVELVAVRWRWRSETRVAP